MSSKPTVLLLLPDQIARQMFRPEQLKRLSEIAEVVGPYMPDQGTPALQAMSRADVIITGWRTPMFTPERLALAPRLKLIAHSAGSVKPIVCDAVFERGIRVTTAAAGNAHPVAQVTIAWMISLLKQMPWIAQAYARNDREEYLRRKALCRELMDISVGIVGASRVGREVLRLLRQFPRLTIRVYDPYLTPEQAQAMGAELCSLEQVCRCEVVSIHAPNLPSTRHMFNARTLALLPDHAVLINTARGALIDEAALVAELHRRPLYVALDVTDPEPPLPDSPLRSAPNLVLTPHIAGAVSQGRFDMGQIAIDETLRFLRGQPLEHEVTPAMLPTQA